MKFSLTWKMREVPLTPVAVVAQGTVARLLALRLLANEDTLLSQFTGVSGKALLVVLGEEYLLPWVDGVQYLGRESAVPGLLVPTLQEPSVPLPLLERALCGQFLNLLPPIAVLPDSYMLLSLAAARPVVRETLLRWLDAEKAGQ